MKYLIGKVIRVDRGGPESRIGKLMDASDDHIALLTEDEGVVYYNTKHIKSLTDNVKGEMKSNIEVPNDSEFKKAGNFQDLFESLKLKWVKINRGGPEKVEGVITEVNKDFVVLINNQEIVHVSMFHIKNMSYGVKIEKAEKEKSDNQASDKAGNQSSNQSKMAESEKQQSRQEVVKSNDDSKNKKNKTKSRTKITSQKIAAKDAESDLSDLLSTMEKFLRNYSKTN
ncbi:hypothetical protein ACIQAA_29145 [Neobacillus sp. NPDC093182]|uniref:hypothetical protein n=1 Tax=Neobacillus sp. NPDC093182 TaxID=3364297 RepID=UPI0037F88150